jgi:hypothetical protein
MLSTLCTKRFCIVKTKIDAKVGTCKPMCHFGGYKSPAAKKAIEY